MRLLQLFKKQEKLIFSISVIGPFLMVLQIVIQGKIAFWFDPARDLLLAISNIQKPSLIGQPTGIPGLFYGPFWIWFLSIPLLFTKNPRIIDFFILTIPYFTIFPLVIYKLKKVLGFIPSLIVWLLFIFGFMNYAFQIWNPHLAPLLILLLIFLLIFENKKNYRLEFLKYFLSGILVGLLFSIQPSLSLGIGLGVLIFVIINSLTDIKLSLSTFKKLFVPSFFYFSGVFFTLIPFLVFEIKHGFNQINVLLNVLTSEYPVVGIKGLTKSEILLDFGNILYRIFHFASPLIIILTLLIMGIFIFKLRDGKFLTDEQKKLLILSFCLFFSVFFVYFWSKNPVWDYHFIGLEILYLLLIGLVINKFWITRTIVGLVLFLIVSSSLLVYFSSFNKNPYIQPNLITKEHEVNIIINDTNGKSFKYFAFNPAIYTYDYYYIFNWKGYRESSDNSLVYLIIPEGTRYAREDFIDFKTPSKDFKTTAKWVIPDGTVILKREK